MIIEMHILRPLALVIGLLIAIAQPAAAQTQTATTVVEAFQGELLEVMKMARRLDVAERYEKLLPSVEKAFNLRLMVRMATSPYWDKASDAQRDSVTLAFKRMNIATVATLFDGYSGQVFEISGESEGPQNTRLVQTKIVSPDRSAVKLVYRLIQLEGRWQIIDVIVDDGISEIQTRRSEYAKSLSQGGVDLLSSVLEAKAKELLGS
jgi:phospholipid transport system substrate-binding protein